MKKYVFEYLVALKKFITHTSVHPKEGLMKNLVILLTAVSSVHSFALGKLTSLQCIANNGVTIKTERQIGNGLQVTTYWGLMTKSFKAKIAETSLPETQINLSNQSGDVLYMINLNLNPLTLIQQKAEGFILIPSVHVHGTPTAVTGIQCDVKTDLSEFYN